MLRAFPNEHSSDDTSLDLQKTMRSRPECWDNVWNVFGVSAFLVDKSWICLTAILPSNCSSFCDQEAKDLLHVGEHLSSHCTIMYGRDDI